MGNTVDLTTGSIGKSLTKLAVPIIGTSFVQMAYNLTDMMWVGRIGSGAVAAVGTAGFFTWLAGAVIILARTGAEVGVAQSVGRRDMRQAKSYARHSIQLIVFLSCLYGLALVSFSRPLMGFYRLGSPIEDAARIYLTIVAFGMPFFMLNPVLTAIFNGTGDSATPFRVNTFGLVLNMILDPIFIFGLGPIPRMETTGAAVATVIAQLAVTVVFCGQARKRPELFSGLNLLRIPEAARMKEIVLLGLPVAVQNALFTTVAMITARIIAHWGALPVAVQRVGSQIESISWMTASGFHNAMSAFVGQNYGAKQWERVRKGYYVGLGLVSVVGLFATFLLIFAGRPIFAVFIPEEEAIRHGVVYLRILGLSQWWMCIEIVTAGAFLGHGRSFPPAVVSIGFNLLRIPGAILLSSTSLGLEGVWWAISMSSVLKGLVLTLWHLHYLRSYRFAGSLARKGEGSPV